MLVNQITNQIFTNKSLTKSQDAVRNNFKFAVKQLKEDGVLTASQSLSLGECLYGIEWGIQTGRATVYQEKAIRALSPKMYVRLIVLLSLRCATSGDAWDTVKSFKDITYTARYGG